MHALQTVEHYNDVWRVLQTSRFDFNMFSKIFIDNKCLPNRRYNYFYPGQNPKTLIQSSRTVSKTSH